MPRKPLHPAIVALRAAVAEFKAQHAGPTGSLLDSDLKHDERAIAAYPDQPFTWIVSSSATYMARTGTSVECRAETTRQWRAVPAYLQVKCVTEECYPDGQREGRMRLYFWNGAHLRRANGDGELLHWYADSVRERANAYTRTLITPLREEMAALRSWGSSLDRVGSEIAALEREIAQRGEWGP